MHPSVLSLTRLIDKISHFAGALASWFILAAIIISAGNALIRYSFGLSSNAWLEIQWVLFSGAFLLGAGYALEQGQHVRIDVLSSRLGPRGRARIDVLGSLVFLLPMCALMIWLSWPVLLRDLASGEVSANAGGLPLWPARLLVFFGFVLLGLQGIAELLKRWPQATQREAKPPQGTYSEEGLPR